MSRQSSRLLEPQTHHVLIRGRFDTSRFIEWIVKHATKLHVTGWAAPGPPEVLPSRAARREDTRRDNNCVELLVQGERTWVEALELACSLGPADADIDAVVVEPCREVTMGRRHPALFIGYSKRNHDR